MSSSTLNLPPTPPELKPVAPYIQRAEELQNQDRIISYWCAYYAAQVGISLKARDPASRDFLFTLLGELERLKAQIGANDAIDIESVSSAYVENFALKVFANADNEDRSGHATRSTAKKFLAAANFLEILKTFPKSEIADSTEEKIRYSKWKAADIAKAFREGRKPSPGPPGWAEEQELMRLQQEELEKQAASESPFLPNVPSNISLTSPAHAMDSYSPHSSSPRSSHHSSSPPKRSPTSSSPPRFDRPTETGKPQGWSNSMDLSSDNWSTAATPGTEFPSAPPSSAYTIGTPTPSTAGHDWPRSSPPQSGALSDRMNQDTSNRIRSGSGSSTSSNTRSRKVSTPTKSSFKSASPESDSDKRVHFSPSTSGSPPPSPSKQLHGTPKEYAGPSSIYAPSQAPVSPPAAVYPAQPSIPPPPTAAASTPSPPRSYIYAPPASSSSSRAVRYTAPPPPPPVEVDLTPALISKIQRHCRFAISALDYEDGEQARKELRAALALLGE